MRWKNQRLGPRATPQLDTPRAPSPATVAVTTAKVHELCNLLTVIEMCGGAIDSALPPSDPRREALRMLEQATRRAMDLARILLASTPRGAGTRGLTRLGHVGPTTLAQHRAAPDPVPAPRHKRPSSPSVPA